MRIAGNFSKWLLLLSVCGLTVFMPGCYWESANEGTEQALSTAAASSTATTLATSPAMSSTAKPTIGSPTAPITSTPSPLATASATTPIASATPTLRATTPAVSATAIGGQTRVDFHPVLAFMGKTTGDRYDRVALYDTADEKLTVVAQGIENEVFNSPLWSPQGDWLAFVQSDSAIGLYHASDGAFEALELAPANPPAGQESEVGILLGGWSYDGNWLAYKYVYEPLFDGESYLLNRQTGRSYPLSFPTELWWLKWSPRTTQIAGYTMESVYIAEASAADNASDMETSVHYQHPYFYIDSIVWHPDDNGLLVSTRSKHNLPPINYLYYLDLDSGEWTSIGKYPTGTSIVAMAYSPNLTEIAISARDYATYENRLNIIAAQSFETVTQLDLPTGPRFYQIEWLTADTLVLSTGDNLYVLPVSKPEQAHWLLEQDNNPLLKAYSSVLIEDWRQ